MNIGTLEDPVEYKYGVNQIQVNAEVGLTFASGCAHGQDPDIVMVARFAIMKQQIWLFRRP